MSGNHVKDVFKQDINSISYLSGLNFHINAGNGIAPDLSNELYVKDIHVEVLTIK